MKFQILFEAKSQKYLKSLRSKDQQRILQAIGDLLNSPFSGKALQGTLKGTYSLRIWPYRVLYKIYKAKLIIIIIDIGHRQSIYK